MRVLSKKLYRPSKQSPGDKDQATQRLIEFGRLGASLIHDIATPLTAASLTLDQMQLDYPNSLVPRVRRDLKQLERYVKAAHHQLKGNSCKVNFSINAVIKEALMMLSSKAKTENVKMVFNNSGTVRIYGDKVKFYRVIVNLLINAIDAYEGADKSSKRVTIGLSLARPNKAVVSVADNAHGIPRRDIANIFDVFYSTKPEANRGLGLGLTAVKRIIETDFKGTIRVSSRLYHGSCFLITIPLASKKSKPS